MAQDFDFFGFNFFCRYGSGLRFFWFQKFLFSLWLRTLNLFQFFSLWLRTQIILVSIFFYYGSGLRFFWFQFFFSLWLRTLFFFFHFFSLWLRTQNFYPKQQFFTYGSGLRIFFPNNDSLPMAQDFDFFFYFFKFCALPQSLNFTNLFSFSSLYTVELKKHQYPIQKALRAVKKHAPSNIMSFQSI